MKSESKFDFSTRSSEGEQQNILLIVKIFSLQWKYSPCCENILLVAKIFSSQNDCSLDVCAFHGRRDFCLQVKGQLTYKTSIISIDFQISNCSDIITRTAISTFRYFDQIVYELPGSLSCNCDPWSLLSPRESSIKRSFQRTHCTINNSP